MDHLDLYKKLCLFEHTRKSLRKIPGAYEYVSSHIGDVFSLKDLYDFLFPEHGNCKNCNGRMRRIHSFKDGYKSTYCNRCAQSAPETRFLIEQRNIAKYGVAHVHQVQAVKDKHRATVMHRYGGFTLQVKSQVDQFKSTMVERYGVPHSMMNPVFVEKRRRTHIENYGVPHPLQNPIEHDRRESSGFYTRYVKILGTTHAVRGSEPLVLKDLEPHLRTLTTKASEMPELYYSLDGTQRRYYPDGLMQTRRGNLVMLEVKSSYTITLHRSRNTEKFLKAIEWCRSNGAYFVVAVTINGSIHYHTLRSRRSVDRLLDKYSRSSKS